MTAAGSSAWRMVVPVKERSAAKSRLRAPDGVARDELAAAFALDTLTAVYDVVPADRVFVVTDDDQVAGFVRARDGVVVPDPGRGLNPAIAAGLAAATPDGLAPTQICAPGAVLLGDLPALTPDELYAGLRACAVSESSVVPDRDGTGTVLLTHHDLRRIVPRFGTGSAARHARVARRLTPDLPRLRTDVDTDTALAQAVSLGVGAHTARVLGVCASVV
ncbi:2-phospho-L-lactate guanylyltransferase [Allobranchiibius sp. GilTou38]|uniref:2-phospho-L-lactate guanylyltransferase n=1 Tax=Allobranchiibius sp. GilTou38 TaxID=2815210 RepID=UPI001AA11DA9|nr:2-phospho-L-lactate guanylyltransferase [Allobranchiibius sp. GilTou38]MBO1765613.1 2-phospho-L-lactate guanylyltransferase [Allobranchiibius sp. GilTou38]